LNSFGSRILTHLNKKKNDFYVIVIFLGVKISTIFGSDLPLNEFRSTGQELIIKFKSHIINGPNRMNNTNAKFLFSYHTNYIGNLINIYIVCFSTSVVKANYFK